MRQVVPDIAPPGEMVQHKERDKAHRELAEEPRHVGRTIKLPPIEHATAAYNLNAYTQSGSKVTPTASPPLLHSQLHVAQTAGIATDEPRAAAQDSAREFSTAKTSVFDELSEVREGLQERVSLRDASDSDEDDTDSASTSSASSQATADESLVSVESELDATSVYNKLPFIHGLSAPENAIRRRWEQCLLVFQERHRRAAPRLSKALILLSRLMPIYIFVLICQVRVINLLRCHLYVLPTRLATTRDHIASGVTLTIE